MRCLPMEKFYELLLATKTDVDYWTMQPNETLIKEIKKLIKTDDFDIRAIENQLFGFLVSFCNKYQLNDSLKSKEEIASIVEQEYFDMFHYSVLRETYFICISNYKQQTFILNLKQILEYYDWAEGYSIWQMEDYCLTISWQRIKDNLDYAFAGFLFYPL